MAETEVPLSDENQLEFKEADLKRHLKNELLQEEKKNNSKADSKDSESKDITQSMVMKDMQLKSAIDVLKTWAVIKGMAK